MKKITYAMMLMLLSVAAVTSARTILSDDFSYAANPVDIASGPQKWTVSNSSGDGTVYTESILWEGNTYSYLVVNEGNTVGSLSFAVQNKNNVGLSVGADLDNGMISAGFVMTSRGEYGSRYWVNLTTNGLRSFDPGAQGISFSMSVENMNVYFGSESTPKATASGFDSSYYTVRIDMSKDVCNFYFRPGQTVDPATLTASDLKFSINTATYQTAINNLPDLRLGIGVGYFANTGGDPQYIRSNFDNVMYTQEGPEPPVTSTPTFAGRQYVAGPKEVSISCDTPNATIYYTTDNSSPTLNSNVYAGPVMVCNGATTTTLKAIAQAPGFEASNVASATYTIPSSYNRPWEIGKSDSINVDGNLTEWRDGDFVPLDKAYDDAGAKDVAEAYYAAKWSSTGKVYVAVKVRDTAQHFTETYTRWDARDAVEVYLHTQGNRGGYDGTWETTQQYVAGIKAGTTNQLWTSLASREPVPSELNFQAAGRVEGQWLYYEFAITPFDYFGGVVGQPSTLATLSENDVIGLDVSVIGNDGQTPAHDGLMLGYTGMKSENTMAPKFSDQSKVSLHKLVNNPSFLNLQWGPVTPNTPNGSAYYLNNNIVNGNVLGGTIDVGPWELDKFGNTIHSLTTASTGKSTVKVGNWIYYSCHGSEAIVYRTPIGDPWVAGTPVTVNDNQTISSLATDGTFIYASAVSADDGKNQIYKYSVDEASGTLTLVWATTGIEPTRVRGLSYYDGVATDYIYAVSGGKMIAGSPNNTAHIYAIRTSDGNLNDLGEIAREGETYQIVRVGKQLWVADSPTTNGKINVYNLTNDITLVSATPAIVCNPEGLDRIFGLAVDGDFVWLTSTSGQVCGFRYNKLRLAGDANGDGMVDVGDLGILAANYGGAYKMWAQGDFNSDGLVDVGDLGILAAHYGEGAIQQSNFSDDYAQAFGITVADTENDATINNSTLCYNLGLPLISGLMLAGLMGLGSSKLKD